MYINSSSIRAQRRPALSRLRRAWHNGEIDTATYLQHKWSGEEAISAALARLQIELDSFQPESQTDEDDGYVNLQVKFF